MPSLSPRTQGELPVYEEDLRTFTVLFVEEVERFFARESEVRTVDLVLWHKSDEGDVAQIVASRFPPCS